MPTDALLSDDVLDPISSDHPAGADLRWTPEWDRIREARRADDDLDAGKWVKKDRKVADWRAVQELAVAALKERTKDLQLALWLTEANMHLHGFIGLRDGLMVTRQLIVRYWDWGLYPSIEDGPEDRAGPLEWLNNKLVDVIGALPITARGDGGPDYSFNNLLDARRVGSESSWRKADGEVDASRKKAYDTEMAAGRISLDQFDEAVKATSRAVYEAFNADFEQAAQNFSELEKTVDEKFGDAAPQLSNCRNIFQDIRIEMGKILDKKRGAEPDRVAGQAAPDGANSSTGNPTAARSTHSAHELAPSSAAEGRSSSNASWEEAQMLVRSGQVDKGLSRMVQLAATEITGRGRFQRKLLLAEACLASHRPRLGRSILEELAEQIDKLQLETWESSEMICGVWSPLFKLYKQGGDSDAEKAEKLYERLCRLDPWQALGFGEG
jgi:type VI secretion system protein ImpA